MLDVFIICGSSFLAYQVFTLQTVASSLWIWNRKVLVAFLDTYASGVMRFLSYLRFLLLAQQRAGWGRNHTVMLCFLSLFSRVTFSSQRIHLEALKGSLLIELIDLCFIHCVWSSSWLDLSHLSSKKGRLKQAPWPFQDLSLNVPPETLPVGFCAFVLWERSSRGGWGTLAHVPLEMVAEAMLLQSQPSGYVQCHQGSMYPC